MPTFTMCAILVAIVSSAVSDTPLLFISANIVVMNTRPLLLDFFFQSSRMRRLSIPSRRKLRYSRSFFSIISAEIL